MDIIAEPGRYFVSSAYTLGVNIIAMRVTSRDESALGEDQLLQKINLLVSANSTYNNARL